MMGQKEIKIEGKSANRKADDSSMGFRLISLYVGSFNCFKKQIMNFCSDYYSSFEDTVDGLLIKIEHKQVLPDNFFALNEGNVGNGCVKSVSEIIGINGSGKTTLARLLCNLPSSDKQKLDWRTVLIYEDKGNITAYSTFPQVTIELISATGEKQSIRPGFVNSTFFPYRLFYYSPHFTTEQFGIYTTGHNEDESTRDEGDYVKNISTTWLLLHPDGNSELLSRVGVRQSSIFDADEKIRLFEFIAEYKAKRKELSGKFGIPMPEYISININHEGARFALDDIKRNAARAHEVKDAVQKQIRKKLQPQTLIYPTDKYLIEVGDVFDEYWKIPTSQYSLVVNIFMSYAAQYIQGSGIFSTSFPIKELQEGFLADLKDFLHSGHWTKEREIKQFLKYHCPKTPLKCDDKNPLLELIELFQHFCKDSEKQLKSHSPTVKMVRGSLFCRLGVPKILKDVCRLVQLHAQTRVISSYLKFDVFPHMSSGEMSFLTLFARLYHFVGKQKEWNNENIVVFLDEAETTLHPEWQRRLVAYCIRFFEVFIPGHQYQLVFASHSPMILSDIPKGNVCRLHRDKKGKCYIKAIDAENTFAANIYDLYAEPFILTGGPIGDFARIKIDGLEKEQDKKIVALVGDELLQKLLNRGESCEK